ncbi:hypothetical protein F5883DRAFT_73057 [Diaporthe sp. PMI_573]|nr:hypothetical protein F5883DRAFT_73057 [Diaporthaceae sp. PMI_573]
MCARRGVASWLMCAGVAGKNQQVGNCQRCRGGSARPTAPDVPKVYLELTMGWMIRFDTFVSHCWGIIRYIPAKNKHRESVILDACPVREITSQ